MTDMTWDIGTSASVIGAIVTGGLTVFVIWSDRNRRKREDEFYVDHAKSCIHEISKYFREIDKRSKIEDMDEDSDELVEQILIKLRRYYKQNHDEMASILKELQKSLRRWRSINKDKRTKYQDIVDEFEWLVNKYFCIDENETGQQARWHSYHEQLTDKRYKIDRCVKLLTK